LSSHYDELFRCKYSASEPYAQRVAVAPNHLATSRLFTLKNCQLETIWNCRGRNSYDLRAGLRDIDQLALAARATLLFYPGQLPKLRTISLAVFRWFWHTAKICG
jgi:hypothetical protein